MMAMLKSHQQAAYRDKEGQKNPKQTKKKQEEKRWWEPLDTRQICN